MSLKLRNLVDRLWDRIKRDRLGQHVPQALDRARELAREVDERFEIRATARAIVNYLAELRHIRPEWIGHGVGGAAILCILIALGLRAIQPRSERANASATVFSEPANNPIPLRAGVQVPPVTIEPSQPMNLPLTLQDRYAAARQRCLEKLYATEAYQTAKARLDDLEGKVKLLRQSDPQHELPQMSVQWVEAKSDVGRMMESALNDDLEVQTLQSAMVETGMLRRGREVYVFESGQKHNPPTTQVGEMSDKSASNP